VTATEPELEPLQVEQRGRVRWLWLNRPERRNALDEHVVDALATGVANAEADPDTAALVIAGRGPSFCAGADLALLLRMAEAGRTPIDLMRRLSSTLAQLERSRLPIVAAVHGHAVAGGLELALAADVVVAAEGTLIGDGHVRNQLMPAGGSSVRLGCKVGPSFARWLLLTGELRPASDPRWGVWLHDVVPGSRLYETTQSVSERLAEQHGPTQARLKTLLAAVEGMHSGRALEVELDAFADHWRDGDVSSVLRLFFHTRRTENRPSRDGDGS
jgi:enoyl-CoA hydratase/carnithine racemase